MSERSSEKEKSLKDDDSKHPSQDSEKVDFDNDRESHKSGDGPPKQQQENVEMRNMAINESVEKAPKDVKIDKAPNKRNKSVLKKSLSEDDTEIKYADLVRYIRDQHPTKELVKDGENTEERYTVCENLGRLPMPGLNVCCFRNCCKSPKTSPMAADLGIGPSLFLMFTKAMGWFFFFVSIINLPVLYFFWVGNPDGAETSATTDTFARMTLGNIGQDSLTCGERSYESQMKFYSGYNNQASRVNQNFTIDLSCGTGNLGTLVGFGYQKTRNDTCNVVKKTKNDTNDHFFDDCK